MEIINALSKYLDSLQKESVSGVWHDMAEDAENGRNIIIIDPKDFYGAVVRKGGSQLKNHNKERYVKWAYIDDVINLSNIERTTKDWKEETVNEELEDFAKRQADEFAEREYEVDSYDRGYLSKGYYWGCKAGAQWQKEQMLKDSVLCGGDGWFINGKRNCRKNGRFHKYYVSTITHDKELPMKNGKDYRLVVIKES